MIKRKDSCRLIISEIRFYKNETIKILAMGLPTGIQSSFFSISNVLIQSGVNSFGIAAVSGNSAATSIENLTDVAMNAFQQTSMNFVGQNVGANNYGRVRKIHTSCMLLVATIGIIIGSLITLFGRQILSLYVGSDMAAIEAGMQKLMFVNLTYFLCGLMEVTSGTLRGMGHSIAPMIIGLLCACVFRITWQLTVFELPSVHSLAGLFISYPISWILAFIANVICIAVFFKKIDKKNRVA